MPLQTSPVGAHTPYPPGKLVCEGTFCPLRKKKEEKIGTWNLGSSLVLAGSKYSTISWTSMNIYINMGINKNCTYLNLFNCAQGLHLALYIGLYALPSRLVQKGLPGDLATAPYG